MKKLFHRHHKEKTIIITKAAFWFFIGICLGLFFIVSFSIIIFQNMYGNKIYPGITISGIPVGGKTEQEVIDLFNRKNKSVTAATFTISKDQNIATISARQLRIGYNAKLLAQQAYSIGRSQYGFSNLILISTAYFNNIHLPPSYTYSSSDLKRRIDSFIHAYHKKPEDGLFTFENGRVTAFKVSKNGQDVDLQALDKSINGKIPYIMAVGGSQNINISLPVKTIKPKISTNNVNNLGIQEIIGNGTSLFQHSAESRVFNIMHATAKINGLLVSPGETFSFNKALGNISQETGFKQAYVIQNGKTVLGDGGGVCQVSTTFFRALLDAGLPILERHAHAYRVGYYEQDAPPGLDATIFVPSVDLKFKNDTGHHILIQALLDPAEMRLTFNLYGTSDGRTVEMTQPSITSQSAAPEPIYQDDPTLPAGTVKQVDFAAPGAKSVFSRKVKRDNKIIYNDTFVSNYRPWQAIYLKGTGQ